jgi:hypothetical protein
MTRDLRDGSIRSMNTTRSTLLRRFRRAVVASPATRPSAPYTADHSARVALVRVFV